MDAGSVNHGSLVFSYLTLRRAIGILGIAFPFLLSLGAALIFRTDIQSSMSGYYHTGVRDVFVGTLCAIGVFLLSYKGYERRDDIAGDLACVFAIGAALLPTTPSGAVDGGVRLIGAMHLTLAALFFMTLIYFSLFLFTKTDPSRPPSRRKIVRNRVYKTCGYTMAACILLVAVYYVLPGRESSSLKEWKPVYWLEAAAVLAFGVSWLTKGEAILGDE